GTNSRIPAALELQRHTGARHVVRARAVHHKLAFARYVRQSNINILESDVERAANDERLCVDIHLAACIDDDGATASLDQLVERVWGDPLRSQVSQHALSHEVLPCDVRGCQDGEQECKRPAELIDDSGEVFQAVAEQVSEPTVRYQPGQRSARRPEQEGRYADSKESGEGWRHRVEPGHELGD